MYEARKTNSCKEDEWTNVAIFPVLTQPGLIALCYTDATTRYGIGGDVAIDIFPRSHSEYSTVGHPSGAETYLVRITAGRRNFFYLLDGHGQLSEHYLTTGSDLTLMPMPNLLGDDKPPELRQPQPSQTIKVKAIQDQSNAEST